MSPQTVHCYIYDRNIESISMLMRGIGTISEMSSAFCKEPDNKMPTGETDTPIHYEKFIT